MQQRIRFCSTTDGARIAYAAVGTGPALIFAQPVSHLELEWEEPRVRDFWETIGRHYMVVRYDKHGCGLSDRKRTDFSLDSEILPIEAIVKDLELKSFVLWARSVETPTAIAYAAKYPDRLIPFEAGRELAAGIPGARFVPLEGDTHLFFFGDTQPLLRAIAEFLGDPIEEVGQLLPDPAKFPSAPEAAQGVFRREGEFWTIACGEVFRLRDVRGLAYIQGREL